MTYVRKALIGWLSEIVWLLEYEPTWFPEFGFAIGALGWGIGAMITDDINVRGWAYALPAFAVVLGIVRGVVLLRLWYALRVVTAALSALLWAWLFIGFAGKYDVVPMMGPLLGCFVTEVLTASKFSIQCAREIGLDLAHWQSDE